MLDLGVSFILILVLLLLHWIWLFTFLLLLWNCFFHFSVMVFIRVFRSNSVMLVEMSFATIILSLFSWLRPFHINISYRSFLKFLMGQHNISFDLVVSSIIQGIYIYKIASNVVNFRFVTGNGLVEFPWVSDMLKLFEIIFTLFITLLSVSELILWSVVVIMSVNHVKVLFLWYFNYVPLLIFEVIFLEHIASFRASVMKIVFALFFLVGF